MVVCLCVLLATGALAGCQFMKPVDGPGMEREVNDSLDSEKGDSVTAETSAGTEEGEPTGEDEAEGLAPMIMGMINHGGVIRSYNLMPNDGVSIRSKTPVIRISNQTWK